MTEMLFGPMRQYVRLPQEETFGIAYSAVRTVDLLLHLIAQMSVQSFYIVHCAGNFSGNILSLCGPNRFLSRIDGFRSASANIEW